MVTKAVGGAAAGGLGAATTTAASNILEGRSITDGMADAVKTGMVMGAINSAATKGCFIRGTPVLSSHHKEMPIEGVHVGQRVDTPDTISSGASSTEVNPATWREFHVRFKDSETGGWDVWDVSLLRPSDWLSTHGSADGTHIWINLEEMHARGWAEVVEVKPCPPVEAGQGRVVTATMTHANDDVRHLRLSTGEDLGVTGNHRMYSAERHDWVPVKALHTGELVQTNKGTVKVESITANPGRQQVFNLEVEQEHCYYAGKSHSLAHNDCSTPESAQETAANGHQAAANAAAQPTNATPSRLPQDVNVSPQPPAALPTNRPIGQSPTQNAAAQAEVQRMQAAGFRDIRVNQQQVNAQGQRVGTNRPDVQGTSPSGQRHYIEFDTSGSTRGPGHEARIRANDPNGHVQLRTVN